MKYSCVVQLELIYEIHAADDEEARQKAEALVHQGRYREAAGPAEITETFVHEMESP